MYQVLFATVWVITCFAQATVHAEPVELHAKIGAAHQHVEGFGASGAWWAQMIGGWEKAEIDEILDLLYGESGAWLTIYRHNIGAGDGLEIQNQWRRTESHEVGPEVYDWARDAHATKILRKVRQYGVNNIVFFSNSPPPRLTHSGMVSGGKKGAENLRPDAEKNYAVYMTDITEYWRKELGLERVTLSPVNEPQWKWGEDDEFRSQEGCHMSPQQVTDLTKAVAAVIRERDLPIDIDAVEGAEWGGDTPKYIKHLLADEMVRESIASVSVHSYWWRGRDVRDPIRALMDEYGPGIPLHMTEYCALEWGRNEGVEAALDIAHLIMEDFVYGGAASWSFWTAVSGHDYSDGLVYVYDKPMPIAGWGDQPEPKRTVHATKRLWALGHFSRFIKPGYRRIETSLDVGGDDSIQTIGFIDNDRPTEVVIVALNRTTNQKQVKITMPGDTSWKIAGHWITDAQRSLERNPLERDRLVLGPKSIHTIVVSLEDGGDPNASAN
jgi:O-glycosyl hydrolase